MSPQRRCFLAPNASSLGPTHPLSGGTGSPWGIALTVVLALAGCVQNGWEDPEESEAPITANAPYAITVVGSGKCLDVYQAATTDGAKVQQFTCGTHKPNQTWRFVAAGSGSYEIVSANSGKVLDVDHGLLTSGALVFQWTWHAADNQRWTVVAHGSAVELHSVASGKCLDVTGASTANGVALQQWTCNGGSNQRFTLTPVADVGAPVDAQPVSPPSVDAGSPSHGGGGSGGTSGAAGAGGSGGASGGAGSGGASGTGGAAGVGGSGAAGAGGTSGSDGCVLQWSPSASHDGKNAFEGLEMPDLNGVHPGAVHFSKVADHDAFRIDQHDAPGAMDYDQKVQDRLRCEVRGMRSGSTNLSLLQGQTWRLSWSLLVPATLKGSTRFNHIWQMKYVDTSGGSSGAPVLTLDLVRQNGVEKILLDVFGVSSTVGVNLLHDTWMTTEVTVTIGAGTAGRVRWTLSQGGKTLADETKSGVSTWPADAARLRPKWGIYRSLGDTSGDIQTTYILLSDFKAYRCTN